MKEKIVENQEKLTAEELLKWERRENKGKELLTWVHQIKTEEELQKLSKNPQLFNVAIKCCEETVKEIEEALQRNIEYPSDKLRYEVALAGIKEKKGLFFNLLRKYEEYKLEKSINKPSKRLKEDSRKLLEKIIKDKKNTIAILKEYKKKTNNL